MAWYRVGIEIVLKPFLIVAIAILITANFYDRWELLVKLDGAYPRAACVLSFLGPEILECIINAGTSSVLLLLTSKVLEGLIKILVAVFLSTRVVHWLEIRSTHLTGSTSVTLDTFTGRIRLDGRGESSWNRPTCSKC